MIKRLLDKTYSQRKLKNTLTEVLNNKEVNISPNELQNIVKNISGLWYIMWLFF